MGSHMHSPSCIFSFFFITILVLLNHLKKCEARDSIYVKTPLSDNGETLVSAGKRFELGFFTTQAGSQKSNKSYVGIWYYGLTPKTVVWVANRDNPLSDSCGFFGIAEDGNIKLWCSNGGISFPVTTWESSATFNRTLQLLDTGNLILFDGQSGTRLWLSFEHPTDTFLPGMKMNDNEMVLTSWTAPSDPGKGDYTFKQDQGAYTIRNRTNDYWKSGEPSTLSIYDELSPFVLQILSDSKQNVYESLIKRARNNSIPLPNDTRAFDYNNTRLFMNCSGEIQYYSYSSAGGGRWLLLWSEPHDACSIYDPCGKFAVCSMKNEPICQCLQGYTSASERWRPGQNSDGCHRQSTCSQEDGLKDGFLNISFVKVGGEATKFDKADNETTCKDECSNNCKCTAYSYIRADARNFRETNNPAGNCWVWNSDLVNLRDDNTGGRNLSLRFPFSTTEPTCDLSTDCKDRPNSECEDRGNGQKRCYCKQGYQWDDSSINCTLAWANLGKDSDGSKNELPTRYVIALTVLSAAVILGFCTCYILYRNRRMAIRTGNQGNTEANPVLFPNESERQVSDLMQENDKSIDVPLYNFDTILSATDNFSYANKLGQGGFGPVYKGKFPGGREIAVKRLSSCSGQGIDEFLNEVVLIAKLQHRNLVRLLGYCIKGNEKMLLYEYMPNRSLDAFIFDQNNCLLVDWKKRFDIILGIARGLLYLHQDSRLRIIHRDLKTSNILLDEEMNPKISDFGLARIVQGKGTEASTNKVVGTYGYMSPEYALDGKFSIKSDVFSFGVVMLEIISGKRNTGFYNPHEVINLLGYAWRLWSENKAIDLVHPTLMLEPHEKSQVIKCINTGLLCVQEDPDERPSMSNVVIMLGSEMTVPLLSPTQPAFVVRRRHSSTGSSSSTKQDTISYNELTISTAQGR